ncbi:MAG: hypothetical protein EPN91_08680 [Salinibacterium sp.]|nr:MAG: hypothetical protein EPN91_08680 [Salinibacterium sp.]
MTRAWIVEKDVRACGNYDCVDYRKKVRGAKFSLDKQTGIARYGCPTCGQTHQTQLRSWKERRACKLCCYVRNVTVRRYTGDMSNPDAADGNTWAKTYCDACEELCSAWNHFGTGHRLQKRAQEKYAARGVDVPTLEQYRKVLDAS